MTMCVLLLALFMKKVIEMAIQKTILAKFLLNFLCKMKSFRSPNRCIKNFVYYQKQKMKKIALILFFIIASLSTTYAQSTPPVEAQPLFKFLLETFSVGFATIFLPCIYPIMPMTVSFFTKQSNGVAKAAFYGFSIMLIFGMIGFVAMIFGSQFLNALSTHWLPNLIFFIVFVLFGFSFLGAFEIVLPHGMVNKIDAMSERGGIIGIFFMALTLVVVSFSCTGPVVGNILILAANGEVKRPLYGMLAFGFPFALVFTSLAMFPQMLKTLPKSGSWLGELKVVFGFLEFALALKFLSNIDLAYHFNLLSRNTFLIIWIILFTIIGLYILGFIRLPSDAKVQKYSLLRIAFAALMFAFVFYMIPGVSGKKIELLSGFIPPEGYGIEGNSIANSTNLMPNDKTKTLPHGLRGFYDYDDALAYSKQVNRPLLLDFTGFACANCRKMEENVWSKPEVLKRLQNDFVIASLYVDDKKELPKEKQFVSTYDHEKKETIGDKNMDLEIVKFNNNAQPYYCVVDVNGKSLMTPIGYSSVEEFTKFLDEGKGKFSGK